MNLLHKLISKIRISFKIKFKIGIKCFKYNLFNNQFFQLI